MLGRQRWASLTQSVQAFAFVGRNRRRRFRRNDRGQLNGGIRCAGSALRIRLTAFQGRLTSLLQTLRFAEKFTRFMGCERRTGSSPLYELSLMLLVAPPPHAA